MRNRHINVAIDLDVVRGAAEQIRRLTNVSLFAVIKADAYGLGAVAVADALSGVADDFAYFSLREAQRVGKPGIVLGPLEGSPADYGALGLRPAITTAEEARLFAGHPAAISVDTGMQRFGCAASEVEALQRLSGVKEAFAHTASLEGVVRFREACGARFDCLHAASSSLLDTPDAWLDAVRPGVALYRGAVRVSTRLLSARAAEGPAGYTGFTAAHIGIIHGGYANRLAAASVVINGRRQRLLEVGMNSAFVSVDPADRAGDEVVLLGDGLTEEQLGAELGCRPHEVLCRYTAMGVRRYVTGRRPPARSRSARGVLMPARRATMRSRM